MGPIRTPRTSRAFLLPAACFYFGCPRSPGRRIRHLCRLRLFALPISFRPDPHPHPRQCPELAPSGQVLGTVPIDRFVMWSEEGST